MFGQQIDTPARIYIPSVASIGIFQGRQTAGRGHSRTSDEGKNQA